MPGIRWLLCRESVFGAEITGFRSQAAQFTKVSERRLTTHCVHAARVGIAWYG